MEQKRRGRLGARALSELVGLRKGAVVLGFTEICGAFKLDLFHLCLFVVLVVKHEDGLHLDEPGLKLVLLLHQVGNEQVLPLDLLFEQLYDLVLGIKHVAEVAG